MFDILIRLILNLTQPAIVCFNHVVPKDSNLCKTYMNVDENLKIIKLKFADKDFLSVLSKAVDTISTKNWDDQSEEEQMLVERILIIVRNILYINTSDTVPDGFWSQHDRVIMALNQADWLYTLTYLANTDQNDRYAFHTLEIVALLFQEQNPDNFRFQSGRSKKNEKDYPIAEKLEQVKEHHQSQHATSHRSMRFGPSYHLLNVKSVTGVPLVYHHDLTGSNSNIDLERDRKLRITPRNRMPNKQEARLHQSCDEVRQMLEEFCSTFLEFGYNNIMKAAHAAIQRQNILPGDDTDYIWAMRFFSCACRLNKLNPEFISATLNMEHFHWVHGQAGHYSDAVGTAERLAKPAFYRKLQLAMAAYRELLQDLIWLDGHSDARFRMLSNRIKCSTFYQEEYIDIYPILLNKFSENYQSRVFLRDLVCGSYMMIKILQNHKEFDMNILKKVQKRRKRRKPVVKKAEENEEEEAQANIESAESTVLPSDDADELAALWASLEPELRSSVSRRLQEQHNSQQEEEHVPVLYDPLAEEEQVQLGSEMVDGQVAAAMGLVQLQLRRGQCRSAVAVLRRAQELWPEEERISVAAADELQPGEDMEVGEMELLKGIMMAPAFYRSQDIEMVQNLGKPVIVEPVENLGDILNDDEEFSEAEEAEIEYVTKEEVFDLATYLRKFAQPGVVHSCSLLLADWATNPTSTNDSLLRLLHRVAFKMHYYHMLYSLRLLAVFNHFLSDPLSHTDKFKELRKFVLHILKKFYADVKNNPKILVEIVFQRNTRDSMEMVTGYESLTKEKLEAWTEELDDELGQLFEELQPAPLLPGSDLVTAIEARFSDSSKTRRQIICRLVNLGLIDSAKDIRGPKTRQKEDRWTEEEHRQLVILADEYRDEKYPIRAIMNALVATTTDDIKVKSRRKVVKKILELGLYDDEKSLGIHRREAKPGVREKMASFLKKAEESSSNEDEDDVHQDQNEDSESDKEEIGDGDAAFIRSLIGGLQDHDDDQKLLGGRPKPQLPRKQRHIDWWSLKIAFAKLDKEGRMWILDMLADNVDSRANGIVGPLTLVPLEDMEIALLASDPVQRLLGLCQFIPPNSDATSSMFWRVPEDMGVRELGYFSTCFQGLTEETMVRLLDKAGPGDAASEIQHTKKFVKSPVKAQMSGSVSDLSDLPNDDDEDTVPKKRVRKFVDSDSENEEDVKSTINGESGQSNAESSDEDKENIASADEEVSVKRPTKRMIVDSDDEDETLRDTAHFLKIKRPRMMMDDDSN